MRHKPIARHATRCHSVLATADCPICSPQYPNLRRARSRPVLMDLCAVSRWCEEYRNKGRAQSSSALDRISEWITPTFQTLSRPEIIRGSSIENEKFPYISITYGGESVSQLPLQDNAFSTFLDQNPPFELRPENWVSLPTKACSANGHRQQCHPATSERPIAVAPTSLIAL